MSWVMTKFEAPFASLGQGMVKPFVGKRDEKEADVEAKESNNLLKSRVSWYAVNILMYLDHSCMYHILFMTVFKRLISFYCASWFQNFDEIWRFPGPFWHRVCHVMTNTEPLKLVCFIHLLWSDILEYHLLDMTSHRPSAFCSSFRRLWNQLNTKPD